MGCVRYADLVRLIRADCRVDNQLLQHLCADPKDSIRIQRLSDLAWLLLRHCLLYPPPGFSVGVYQAVPTGVVPTPVNVDIPPGQLSARYDLRKHRALRSQLDERPGTTFYWAAVEHPYRQALCAPYDRAVAALTELFDTPRHAAALARVWSERTGASRRYLEQVFMDQVAFGSPHTVRKLTKFQSIVSNLPADPFGLACGFGVDNDDPVSVGRSDV